jgi:hypothetical protein
MKNVLKEVFDGIARATGVSYREPGVFGSEKAFKSERWNGDLRWQALREIDVDGRWFRS